MSIKIETQQALLYTESYKLKKEGNLLKAIECYLKLVELNKHNYYALSNLGFCYRELGNFEKAFEFFDKALEIKPRDVSTLMNKGLCYIELQNYKKGLSYLNKCTSSCTSNLSALVYFHQANCYNELNDYFKALENYDKALNESNSSTQKKLPSDILTQLYLKKAFSEFKLKKYLQSLSTLENVTNTSHREKNKFKLLHLKGMVLYNLKKYNDAVSSFEQCIELKPNDANLYYHKGLSLFFTKKYKEALECFTKAYGLDNTLQNSLYLLLSVLSLFIILLYTFVCIK